MKRSRKSILSLFAALTVSPLSFLSAQEVKVESPAIEMVSGETRSLEVDLKDIPSDKKPFLCLTAWIDADKLQGYAGALKVQWNGVELKKSPRPALLVMADGRSSASYSAATGWTLPYLKDPAHYDSDPESPYRLPKEVGHPADLRLELPEVFDGKQEIQLECTTSTNRTVTVENIAIRYE